MACKVTLWRKGFVFFEETVIAFNVGSRLTWLTVEKKQEVNSGL